LVGHKQRVMTPLKRMPGGSHAPISWPQAVSEIAARLGNIVEQHGPEAFALLGGGGQANHLDFVYAVGFLRPPVLPAPPETRQECIIFYKLAKAMGLDYQSNPAFAALEGAIAAGDPAPVLTIIKGLCMLFAMTRQQELLAAGTISTGGNAADEVFQKLLDHPEGVLLCKVDPKRNWEQVRTADQKAVLDRPG
jgi:Molybdopterin oxidoreductase